MLSTTLDSVLADYAAKYKALLTAKTAAEIADVPLATIHAWSSAGKFDDFKHRRGRQIRLRRDDFVKFLLNEK